MTNRIYEMHSKQVVEKLQKVVIPNSIIVRNLLFPRV